MLGAAVFTLTCVDKKLSVTTAAPNMYMYTQPVQPPFKFINWKLCDYFEIILFQYWYVMPHAIIYEV